MNENKTLVYETILYWINYSEDIIFNGLKFWVVSFKHGY